jgi:hypothetical protein
MGCAENRRRTRRRQNRRCHKNETIFFAPQRIDGEEFTQGVPKKLHKNM